MVLIIVILYTTLIASLLAMQAPMIFKKLRSHSELIKIALQPWVIALVWWKSKVLIFEILYTRQIVGQTDDTHTITTCIASSYDF